MASNVSTHLPVTPCVSSRPQADLRCLLGSPLEYLGGENLVGTVAATASLNRLDIVAQGVGGNYYYKYFDGSSVSHAGF